MTKLANLVGPVKVYLTPKPYKTEAWAKRTANSGPVAWNLKGPLTMPLGKDGAVYVSAYARGHLLFSSGPVYSVAGGSVTIEPPNLASV